MVGDLDMSEAKKKDCYGHSFVQILRRQLGFWSCHSVNNGDFRSELVTTRRKGYEFWIR